MRVSLNTIKQYVDFELPPVDELVARINAQLGGVEEVIDLSEKYKDVVIVKVVECEKHPNADRLNVTKIDDGGTVENVPRDDSGLVQVVCGAPNVHAGMFAAWLPPRSTVPASFDDKEPFVLEPKELRGVVSQGMLAAGDELAINADHNGIIEIDPSEWKPSDVEIKAGASFAEAYGLNDTIIDIENKMFTHRPDLFGQLGVAREIAGIFGHAFTSPAWYLDAPQFGEGEGLKLEVFNDTPEKVPRFMAVALKNVTIKPSPLWLQIELVRLGSKSINNIVDVTNYVMLLTAQPVHAYDYDKLRGARLGARMAKPGEKVVLLNGKTYELTADDIVIADGEGAVGLAGIMGGGNSEVSPETTNIVLEVATFDMYAVRKTSMRNGIFTDALTRFNKGQSPLQNDHVLNLLMMSVKDVSSAEQSTKVFDEKTFEDQHDATLGDRWMPETIPTQFINDRLGVKLSEQHMLELLQNVEFSGYVLTDQNEICVTAPFWRTDIEQAEDIVEEVGRLYGFDKLMRELPMRSIRPAVRNKSRAIKKKLREILQSAGANEVLTYSFVHENTMKKALQDTTQAFQLSNALSPDLQFYRLSVLPSLLDKVHANIKAGYDEFVLYEIGKAHNKKYHANDDEGLPLEMEMLDAIYTSKRPNQGAAYYQLRRLLDYIASDLHISLRYKQITEPINFPLTAPFDQARSALVETNDGTFIGMIGELQQQVVKNFKLPPYSAAMSLDIEGLRSAAEAATQSYRPMSKYPSVHQDVSLKVPSDVSYDALHAVLKESLSAVSMYTTLAPVAIYQPEDDRATKTVTFRVQVTSFERTLREEEVTKLVAELAEAARQQLGAEII